MMASENSTSEPSVRPRSRRSNAQNGMIASPFPMYFSSPVMERVDRISAQQRFLNLPNLSRQIPKPIGNRIGIALEHCVPINRQHLKETKTRQAPKLNNNQNEEMSTEQELNKLRCKSKEMKRKIFGSSGRSLLPSKIVVPKSKPRVRTLFVPRDAFGNPIPLSTISTSTDIVNNDHSHSQVDADLNNNDNLEGGSDELNHTTYTDSRTLNTDQLTSGHIRSLIGIGTSKQLLESNGQCETYEPEEIYRNPVATVDTGSWFENVDCQIPPLTCSHAPLTCSLIKNPDPEPFKNLRTESIPAKLDACKVTRHDEMTQTETLLKKKSVLADQTPTIYSEGVLTPAKEEIQEDAASQVSLTKKCGPTDFYSLTKTFDDVRIIFHPQLEPKDVASHTPPSMLKGELSKKVSKDESQQKERKSVGASQTIHRSDKKGKHRQCKAELESDHEEHVVTKKANDILYEIAAGKWNYKNLVLDEDTEETRKLGSQPCSNAYCLKEAERKRQVRQNFEQFKHDQMGKVAIFEENKLPSYHSLLNMWGEESTGYSWLKKLFPNGFPANDADFLRAWRACRGDPEAFGIQITEPKELPEIESRKSRVVNLMKSFKGLAMTKAAERPPIRLPSVEYYKGDLDIPSPQHRASQRQRYDELKRLYPHLPTLRIADYTVSPETVKHRLKQAEDWHRLVTASNTPTSCVIPAVINTRRRQEIQAVHAFGRRSDFVPTTRYCGLSKIPGYANDTTSSMNKIRKRDFAK